MIKLLDKQTTQKMVAQPIITTLQRCVKQLIDNSVDGQATFIKVQLQNYGKQHIYVYDNGSGIKQVQKIGEKGVTSKLKQIDSIDPKKHQNFLAGIRTLGFRGQAIHSIAKLSEKMIINTVYSQNAHSDQNTKQEDILIQCKYDVKNKKVISKGNPAYNKTSTMITVERLFNNLPIRRHELESHPKQNLKKVYDLMFEISLIYPQIKFILSNTRQGNSEEILFETYTKGSKQDLKQKNKWKQMWQKRLQDSFPNKLEGNLTFISAESIQGFVLNTIDSGSSRKNHKFSKNFQFLFINRRPINPIPSIVKLIQSYYKKYNPYTKYLFFINLKVCPTQIDVNRSINKRDIFLIKECADKIQKQLKQQIQKQVIEKVGNLEQFKNSKAVTAKNFKQNQELNDKQELKKRQLSQQQQMRRNMYPNTHQQPKKEEINLSGLQLDQKVKNQFSGKLNSLMNASIKMPEYMKMPLNNNKIQERGKNSIVEKKQKSTIDSFDKIKQQEKNQDSFYDKLKNKKQQMKKENKQTNIKNQLNNFILEKSSLIGIREEENQQSIKDLHSLSRNLKIQQIQYEDIIKGNNEVFTQIQKNKISSISDFKHQSDIQPNKIFNFENQALKYITDKKGQLKKQDFKYFHIHGQFNKGFILCSLTQEIKKNEQQSNSKSKNSMCTMYIVDQHAAEQKSWFQTFIATKPQYIIASETRKISPLQADAIQMAQQSILKSGFGFSFNESRNQVILQKVPTFSFLNKLKKIFGFKQFLQVVQANKSIKQLPCFYNTAASTACRKAVMIGDQLTKKQMRKIVHNMSALKSPWNCPHGRPSLIQLGNFKKIVHKISINPSKKYKI